MAKVAISKSDLVIEGKDKELMMAKGTMTCRGIFEFYLTICYAELKGLGALGDKEKLIYTNFIQKVTATTFTVPSKAFKTSAFFEAMMKCGMPLDQLSVAYSDLCNDVHGYPWHGTSVKVFTDQMQDTTACLVSFIAEQLNLDVDVTVQKP